MKKKVIVTVAVGILLAICIGVGAWYLSPVIFLDGVAPDGVVRIDVFNGGTGKCFTVEGADEIKYIVENIQGGKMRRGKVSTSYDGFSFSLSFYGADGELIDSFILNSETVVRDDPFFYERESGELCYGYLTTLEEKYAK